MLVTFLASSQDCEQNFLPSAQTQVQGPFPHFFGVFAMGCLLAV
jgi:hypothetical protein